jgi:hypothetical protein
LWVVLCPLKWILDEKYRKRQLEKLNNKKEAEKYKTKMKIVR